MANSLVQISCLIFLLLHFHGSASKDTPVSSKNLIHSSCVHASYPNICLRTLSAYPDPPQNQRELTRAAVQVSISHSKKLSNYLKHQKAKTKREKTVIKDCLDQISDSVDELKKTLSELKHLKKRSFEVQMSNAETWVSAALTNDETCLDSFEEAAGNENNKKKVKGKVMDKVRNKVVGVAKVTSNALYLINQLGAKQG